ncbi:MAG: zinc-dependent alcohol dehydrogenase family protein [Melioribacteraceae bacterium]|nr:zinc-dependent alcohol dehydrogenase family protein [Melioribacteraceae bacterium]
MKSVVFRDIENLEISEAKLRSLNDNELIIEVANCGVCGTDFHIYNGHSQAKQNTILGHEFVGTIIAKGMNCNGFEINDNIAVDPNIYCGKCDFCKEGKVQFCEEHKALGVTEDGGFAEYAIVPVSQAYKLPKEFPLSDAAFAEPLSCCIRGIDQAEIKHGDSVVIVGGGTIGLLMLQLARLAGASKTIVIEPNETKHIYAQELGVDLVLSSDKSNLLYDLKKITHGGADKVIECVGSADAVSLSLQIIKRGGTVVIFGLAPEGQSIQLNLQEAFKKELTIKTSFLNPFTFGRAIELLVNRKVVVDTIPITEIDFDSFKEIFSTTYKRNTLKYQFTNKLKETL